ncbi:MAG: methyltransferase domain-containing protein [Terriglobia bacterium]
MRKPPGAIGIDRFAVAGVDVVCDLNAALPIADNAAAEIRACHVLEHLDDVAGAMREIWKVCRPGGRVKIWTPHFSSGLASWSDPTHKRTFTTSSFEYFQPENNSHYAQARFRVDRIRLHFSPGGGHQSGRKLRERLYHRLGRALERWANHSRRRQKRVERFLCRLVSFDELYVELRAEKQPAGVVD